jgi:hypothetical protein
VQSFSVLSFAFRLKTTAARRGSRSRTVFGSRLKT